MNVNTKPVTMPPTVAELGRARPATPSKPDGRRMCVVALDSPAALADYTAAWEDLAGAVIEPNPFYEPWMLMPGLRAFGAGKDFVFALVFAPDKARPGAPPILCGLFPFEIRRQHKGIPVKVLSLWSHLHSSVCAPLVRTDQARECVSALFDWLEESPFGCALADFGLIPGEGPLFQLIVEQLHRRAKLSFVSDCHARAVIRPHQDAARYLRASLSRTHRKDLNRKQRRLTEIGRLEYTELPPDGDVEKWIEDFLRLEASGWKGRSGGALSADQSKRTFFAEAVSGAFARGRLMMLAAHLDGRPIAQKCNILARPGSFAFKIAYDESYAYYSPGVNLEVENIRRLHARTEIEWMDSGAIPDHYMINNLWIERRVIQSIQIATGKASGELVVSTLPLIRWLNRKLRGISNLKTQNKRAAEVDG